MGEASEMPLPEPRDGESKDDFVERCMGDDTMQEEFEDPAQRRAVCERQWDDAHKGQAAGRSPWGQYIYNTPWAILESKLLELAQGTPARAENLSYHAAAAATRRQARTVAVLPLYGVISQRVDLWTLFGGTAIERFRAAFRQALADPEIGAILIDVDSPGGAVGGVDELSADIYRARGQKPIFAIANGLAASGAYWIASAADELIVTPSGEVGAIGVFAIHEDYSRYLDALGLKVSMISAGKYKAEGNPFEPLGEEARAHLQRRVDEYYELFVKAVARNRGIGVGEVREGYGEGRLLGARAAKAAGMVDAIETFDEAVDRLARKRRTSSRTDQASGEIDLRKRRLRMAGR